MRTITTLTLDEALAIQSYLRKVADTDRLGPVAISIVGSNSLQLCSATMDGTKPASTPTALNKALTAITYGRDTIEFCHTKPNGTWVKSPNGWNVTDFTAGSNTYPFFMPWGGAVLVRSGEAILGAVGISGLTEIQDHDLASKWTKVLLT